jgi:2-(1,2-epoxy-1,2-dihydrophenyl)acetyl-CoA isomerase
MLYETILSEITDGVARITLNRPDRLNSFTEMMHLELRDALQAAERSARAVLITGAGRGFCAGQDLGDRARLPAGTQRDLGRSIELFYGPLVRQIRALPLPVIAQVNGVAAGAGVSVVLACDLVIASRAASFVLSFTKIGLMPDSGSTYFLPRIIGSARAAAMALTGNRVSAEEAERWGLIWKCVDPERLASECEELALELARGPALSYARTKEALTSSFRNTLDEQIDLERTFVRELGNSPDYQEGVDAFLAKRPPRFGASSQ